MENQKKTARPEKEKTSLKAEIISWIQVIVCAALIAFFMNSFIIANSRVPSGSMENTIMTGDRVIGSRLQYKFFGDPERGDVIIFRWPDNEKILFVKRIIGLPGDTVTIRSGHVFLNDSSEPLEETYLKEDMMVEPEMTFTVPENAYFCLGDNRNDSEDSRHLEIGLVESRQIKGKLWLRYSPGDQFGIIQ